jgi:ubiquinone/menaquinone biosynthesis C-methylase UbiE
VIRLIRWCFERFYREFAWTYDTVAAAVSWGHWRSWALTVVPLLHGDLLEIGCGTGNLQAALADHTATTQVIGLDVSWPMLLLTRRKTPSARLLQSDVRCIPLADRSFDCVVATFPSEYIADPGTLAELWRILRPGGQLVILLGAQWAGPVLYRRLIALAYRLVLPAAPVVPNDLPTSAAGLHLLAALAAAGLAARDRWVAAPGGAVYLIEAQKH